MATNYVTRITGTLVWRERLAMPEGTVCTVKLVDQEGEVLAATAVAAEADSAPFTLHADPEDRVGKQFIWAKIRSEAGIWGTLDLVPVTADDTEVSVTKIDT